MAGGKKRKGRDRHYYSQQAKRARVGKFHLAPGMRGFLLFTNHKERDALREGYSVLNEYADKLYGKEVVAREEGDGQREEEDGDDDGDLDDVDAAVNREKEELSRLDKQPRRFQKVETGTQNLLFVKTTLEDPVRLATTVMDGIRESGKQRTQNLIRLVPVEATCKAFKESFEKAASEVIPKAFATSSHSPPPRSSPSYCVVFKSRLNDGSLTKEDAVEVVGGAVRVASPSSAVRYKDPDLTVVVEVMKGHARLAVLPRYAELRRFNAVELAVAAAAAAKEKAKHGKSGVAETGRDAGAEGKEEEAEDPQADGPSVVEERTKEDASDVVAEELEKRPGSSVT